MDPISVVALSMGAAWASGINLYATVLILGLSDSAGVFDLPPSLEILSHPGIMVLAAVLYLIEFLADKIPGVDSLWDSAHTFVRIPAGALLAAGATGLADDLSPGMMAAAALVAGVAGGSLTAATHAGKSGGRLLINTSPEPFSNIAASILGDIAVVGGLLIAIFKPVIFIVILILFAAFLAWFIPKVWTLVKKVFGRFFGARPMTGY